MVSVVEVTVPWLEAVVMVFVIDARLKGLVLLLFDGVVISAIFVDGVESEGAEKLVGVIECELLQVVTIV